MKLRKGQRLYALIPNVIDGPPEFTVAVVLQTWSGGCYGEAQLVTPKRRQRRTRQIDATTVGVHTGWWTTRGGAESDYALMVFGW